MNQTLTPANTSQQTFINTLAEQLGIRNLDSYLDSRFGYPAPEHMTGAQASHIIDVLKLRKLSQRVKRPIAVDLTDRSAVTRELERLEALNPHSRNGNSSRSRYLGKLKDQDGADARIRAALRREGVTIKQVEPCPANLSTAQMTARAIEARQTREATYATGRYSETVGRGSNASYSVQVADSHTMGAEPLLRQATEPMLDYIRSLSDQKNIPVGVIPTRFDLAQELLTQLIDSPKMPTASMKRELDDLRKATDSNPNDPDHGTYDHAMSEIKALRAEARRITATA